MTISLDSFFFACAIFTLVYLIVPAVHQAGKFWDGLIYNGVVCLTRKWMECRLKKRRDDWSEWM